MQEKAMGFVLLGVENLAISLLLVATVVACAGRWRRRWLRVFISSGVVLALLVGYGGLTAMVNVVESRKRWGTHWAFCLLALTAGYTLGAVIIVLVARRRKADGESTPRATNWPRGKLATALFAAIVLQAATIWYLDRAAYRRALGLEAEAVGDEWDKAHRIVQNIENKTAYWIHAVLHKIEGDRDNST